MKVVLLLPSFVWWERGHEREEEEEEGSWATSLFVPLPSFPSLSED